MRRALRLDATAVLHTIVEVPARKGHLISLAAHDEVEVVNTFGGQVVDTWAFPLEDSNEYMSMEHSRVAHYRLAFRPGDTLYSDRWRPVLSIVRDTSPGVHDTLCPACSEMSYRKFYGSTERHDNCSDNLRDEFRRIGRSLPRVPTPWNLFMETVVVDNSRLEDRPSRARPGDLVHLRAETDCLFAVSACPQDIVPINGKGVPPRGVALHVHARAQNAGPPSTGNERT
jgi:uncharacterized protein